VQARAVLNGQKPMETGKHNKQDEQGAGGKGQDSQD
jgi:hypothetical protein